MTGSQRELRLSVSERKTPTLVTSSVRGRRSTIEFSNVLRSVCELRPRPKSISVCR